MNKLQTKSCQKEKSHLGSSEAHSKLVNDILIKHGSGDKYTLWKNHTGVARAMDSDRIIKFGLNGSADIIGFRNDGKFIAIECKTGNAKQSKSQESFQKACIKFNAIYILAKCVDDLP